MTLYAENINGESALGEKLCYSGGIYLHGKLEKINGYDIVDILLEDFESIAETDSIHNVEVAFMDGTKHDAIAYIWRSPSQFEMKEHSKVPLITEFSIFHGLICAIDDIEANTDALKKFNARARYI